MVLIAIRSVYDTGSRVMGFYCQTGVKDKGGLEGGLPLAYDDYIKHILRISYLLIYYVP